MKFIQKNIDALTLPRGKDDHLEWDSDFPGFGIRLRQGGSKDFILQYKLGDKQRRIKLGSARTLKLDQARKIAAELRARIHLGFDPAGERGERRARAAETVGAVLQIYLPAKRAKLKRRTYVEIERHLLKHAKSLHELQLVAVDRRTIATKLAAVASSSGPVAADRVRASLSAFFAWAVRRGLVLSNPVVGTERSGEGGPRDRVLDRTELWAIWHALEDSDYGAILKLLILTGQRREEIAGLRRSEIDFDAGLIRLPPERTKNKRSHAIPIGAAILAILQSRPRRSNPDGTVRDLIFGSGNNGYSGWSKSKSILDQRLENLTGKRAVPWRLHDIRRTVATGMADIGIQPHVIEAVLNHVSGHKAGVAGIYNRSMYAAEKASALTRWAEHLMAIVEERERKVIPLRAEDA